MGLLYQDFALEDEKQLADFHIRIDRPRNLRRWWRPQAHFSFDGHLPFNPMPARLAAPFWEWGLNWCIANYAHQFLVIHAAVVERGGHALLITAPPGSGKSTLCAALASRGWRLLSDELALIRPEDGQIAPLPRPIGLKNESIAVIRRFAPEVFIGPLWRDTRKGIVAHMRPAQDAVRRSEETALPSWIIFLSYRAGSPAKLEPVKKSRALIRLAESAFNYGVLGELGFETTAHLTGSCSCYEFTYGNLDEAIEQLGGLSVAS